MLQSEERERVLLAVKQALEQGRATPDQIWEFLRRLIEKKEKKPGRRRHKPRDS